jgi:hypothetical protein
VWLSSLYVRFVPLAGSARIIPYQPCRADGVLRCMLPSDQKVGRPMGGQSTGR